jgi:acetyl-CoA carboxylase biotin carboxyl carrier protein
MSKQNTDTDVAFISALAELLNKNDLTELSVKREYGEDDSLEVRVVKQSNVVTVAAAPAPVMHHAPPPPLRLRPPRPRRLTRTRPSIPAP